MTTGTKIINIEFTKYSRPIRFRLLNNFLKQFINGTRIFFSNGFTQDKITIHKWQKSCLKMNFE